MSKTTAASKKQIAAKETTVNPVVGEYQGKATLTLKRSEDDKWPFTFGVSKAKLMIQHIDSIRQFVEQHEA